VVPEDSEFFPADASDHTIVADDTTQRASDRLQNLIAKRVAIGVVDSLEVVDVDQCKTEWGRR
jgi:hypothetical protein